MTTGLVSVVIPAFNGEAFLGQALDSVFAQSYRPLEVLVVDDGSSDGTAAIARSFAEVRYLGGANRGVSVARNRGIEASSGEFIALLDQDDIWMPEKLERQVAALGDNPEAGFALCYQEHFLEPGTAMPAWIRDASFKPEPTYVPSGWLVRRMTFERVGLFDPRYRVGQDTDWLARAKDQGVEFVMVPEVLMRKRVHSGNLSAEVRTGRKEILGLLRASVGRQRDAGGA